MDGLSSERIVGAAGATEGDGSGPAAESDPARVSSFRLDKYLVTVARFRQFGPQRFIVSIDGGRALGERELETDVAVDVAVGEVMDHLAYGPATGTVACVELLFVEPFTEARSSAGSHR